MLVSKRSRAVVVVLVAWCVAAAASAASVGFWRMEVVDTEGDVGRHTSLAILPSGQPAISYHDATNKDLKYAWYNGVGWQITTVDSGGFVGEFTSLVVLPSGQPAISYSDRDNSNLKYAWRDGAGWHTTTVDHCAALGFASWFTSLAVLPAGYPAISYWFDGSLKYARYDGFQWHSEVVDDQVAGGATEVTEGGSALAVLPSGQPAIAYCAAVHLPDPPPYGTNLSLLKYAWFDGTSWHVGHAAEPLEGYLLYMYPRLAILPSGQPALSYNERVGSDKLAYQWYDGSTWHTSIIDGPGVGAFNSLEIMLGGLPAVSYFDSLGHHLKYAWFDGNAWHSTTVDSANFVGWDTSLACLPSGQPAISYYDWPNGSLKYALGFYRGDLNCDGAINFDDISPFVMALSDPAGYQAAFPDCHVSLGDINGDGLVNFDDINPFVQLLSN